MIQLTAYDVLGSVQWALMGMETVEGGHRWRHLATGLLLPVGDLQDLDDVAWEAMQAAQHDLLLRRS